MSDLVVSLVRTNAAVWVPAAAIWLAHYGIELPVDATTIAVTAVAVSAYYTLARVLEVRWPALGVLLGSPRQPSYDLGRSNRNRESV